MYDRHEKLLGDCFSVVRNSVVFVAGVGGLGCTVSQLLVRLGVKKIYIADCKEVDEPDLNRQILYTKNDLGKFKVEVAYEYLKRIREDIEIIRIKEKLDESFVIPKEVDVVFDCLDNFKTRYVLDELVHQLKIPMIHAGVKEYGGQVTVIFPGKTPKLKDIFPGMVDENEPFQIFPPTVTLAASLQVSEFVKVTCGNLENAFLNKILVFDLLENSFEYIQLG